MHTKKVVAISVLLILLLSGCTRKAFNNENVAFFGTEAPTAAPVSTPSAAPVVSLPPVQSSGDVWTVMIYLNGSDLESENGEATRNLQSLLSVHIPDNIRVLVYTGGTKDWDYSGIDASQNQIWLVQDGGLVLLQDMGKKSIGLSATLAEFLTFGQTCAPYDKKALILWDHGGGSVMGFGSDEWFGYDGLYLYELADAMEASYDGTPFDLIGFDACLMASVETASVLAPYARTMVASEEVEPGGGWDYRSAFNQLSLKPEMTGEELGISITDSYYDKYKYTPTEGYITCSVIDLEKLPVLEQSLGDFSEGLSGAIVQPTSMQTLSSARQNAESYGDDGGSSFDMIDLYSFVEQQPSADVSAAEALKTAIEDAVVYEVSGSQRIYSYGLSVYFPFVEKDYFDYSLNIYEKLDFCPEYQQFIADFAACITDETYTAEVPEYTETDVFEVPDIGQDEDFSEVGSYYVELTDEQLDYLGYVYCTLGWYLDDGTLIDLGDDSDLSYDAETNTIRDDFDGGWTGIGDQPVALYILEETEDYLLYNIPILYNGQRAVIKCAWVWDDTYDENGYYVVNGVFLTNDEYSVPDTRMEVTVAVGDTVTPIYNTISAPDGYEGYWEGTSITLGADGLSVELIWLPDGTYQYGFKFIDIYGYIHYSELVDIPVSNS